MKRMSGKALLIIGAFVCAVIAAGVSYYASSSPDGLEYVAEQVGFSDTAQDSAVADSPLADYGTAGVEDERLSGGLAGLIGIGATGVIAFGLMWLLRQRKNGSDDAGNNGNADAGNGGNPANSEGSSDSKVSQQ